MAGVLEQIMGSRRTLVKDNVSSAKMNQKVLELQVAMEILAEVFGTDLSEIDEIIRMRYKEGVEGQAINSRKKQGQPLLKHRCGGRCDWPVELCLAE